MEIKAFALGGIDEIGKVCFVIEVEEEIYVFDTGLKYLNNIDLGNNIIIPDYTYLIQNKHRIKGIFLSKIDINISYSIKYLLPHIKNTTIYTSKINKEIISKIGLLTKEEVYKNVKIISDNYISIGKNQIKNFNTASNLPGSCGFILKTNDGLIIYTGSFVIETNKNHNIFNTSLNKIPSNEKVLLLISNVSNIITDGFSVPKTRVDNWLNETLDETRENLYICCYDNDWYKIHNIIKKIHLLNEEFNISFFDKKFLDFYKEIMIGTDPIYNQIKFIDYNNIKRSKNTRNIIIITGDQKWLFSRITRIVNEKNINRKLINKDSVLLLGENKFNFELAIVNIMNVLFHTDAKIRFISKKKIIPMEAGTEDLKLFCSLLKPKYFFPFNAYYKEIQKSKEKLIGCLDENQIIICNNGDVIKFKNGIKKEKISTVTQKSVFIDVNSIKNLSDSIIIERRLLGSYGVLFLTFGYMLKLKKYIISTNIKLDFIGINLNDKNKKRIEIKTTELIKKTFKYTSSLTPNKILKLIKTETEKILKKELNNIPLLIPIIINT